jgi:hypothetical protein
VSDLEAPPPPDHAAPFLAMAAKITTNRDNGFAGAFVIVGPGGEVEATLILDGSPNVSAFWSLIATKSQIAIAEAEANQQAAQGGGFGYGGGRR